MDFIHEKSIPLSLEPYNLDLAIEWYDKAAVCSDGKIAINALLAQAKIYKRMGNLDTALTKFRRAGDKGSNEGNFEVAQAYEDGEGCHQSRSLAEQYYKKVVRRILKDPLNDGYYYDLAQGRLATIKSDKKFEKKYGKA